MSIITEKHVQKLIIQQAVDQAQRGMASYQNTQNVLSGGASIMPSRYSNGFYDAGGTWHDYLMTDYNAMNEGVLK